MIRNNLISDMFNNTINQKILYNTFIQFASKLIILVLSLVSVSIITRHLGTVGYGNYAMVFTYISFFAIFSDIGLNTIIVREFSGDEVKTTKVKATYINLKIILISISVTLSIIGLIFLPYTTQIKAAILMGTIAVAIGSFSSYGTSLLQSKIKLNLVALVELVTKLATVAAIIYVTRSGQGLYQLIASVLFGNIVGLIISLYFVRSQISFKLYLDKDLVYKLIRLGLPIGITSFISLLYFKVDVLILSIIKSSAEVGIYSLSYKLLENILIFWGLYMASIFPLLSKFYASSDVDSYRGIVKKTAVALIALSIIVILFGYVFAPTIIKMLAGPNFILSIKPFRILLLAVPFFLLNNLYYSVIISFGRTKFLVLPLFISLILNTVLNILIIPKYGYIGASISTVVTEILTSIFYTCIIYTNFNSVSRYWKIFK